MGVTMKKVFAIRNEKSVFQFPPLVEGTHPKTNQNDKPEQKVANNTDGNQEIKLYPCKGARAAGKTVDAIGYAFFGAIPIYGWCFLPSIILKNCFRTNPNEVAVVVHNGKPYKVVTKPGLHYESGIRITGEIYIMSTGINIIKAEANNQQDRDGFPINTSYNISWKITEPLKAIYGLSGIFSNELIEEFKTYKRLPTEKIVFAKILEQYIKYQAIAVLKDFVAKYPLLSKDGSKSLNNLTSEMKQELNDLLQAKLDAVGVKVNDFDLTSVLYADKERAYLPQTAAKMGEAHQILEKSGVKHPETLLQTTVAKNSTVSTDTNNITLKAESKSTEKPRPGLTRKVSKS